jgi:thioredoxin-like negative regulator of GroEL
MPKIKVILLISAISLIGRGCRHRDWVTDPSRMDDQPSLSLGRSGGLGTEAAYAHYTAAELLYENGDFKGARRELSRALASDDADLYLNTRLALLLIELGEFGDARNYIDRVLESDRRYAFAWLALARLHQAEGADHKAEAAARQAIRIAPDEVEAALWLAEVKRRQGQLLYAAELLTQAEEAEPLSAEVHLALGRVSLSLRRYPEARRHLFAFLKLRPGRSDVIAELARAHEADGRIKEAADLLELALEKDPTNEPLRLRVIDLFFELGAPHRARRHIDSLAALENNDTNSALARARLLSRAALFYEARELVASQLEAHPSDPKLALALSAAEIRLGRLEAAEWLLNHAEVEWSKQDDACRKILEEAVRGWPTAEVRCGLSP